jgi:ketosteroid isomerase-like protein
MTENTALADDDLADLLDVDTSAMTEEQLVEHNLRVVDAHFHNENPDCVDKALALYAPDVVWESPFRGQVYRDAAEVKEAYLAIFDTLHFNRMTSLRRFATEEFVFDDCVLDVTVVGDRMPNLGFGPGDRISMRLVHCFEMKDGRIAREIAYEMSREYGGPLVNDDVPDTATITDFPDGPHYGQW